jgi:hypothetical protein
MSTSLLHSKSYTRYDADDDIMYSPKKAEFCTIDISQVPFTEGSDYENSAEYWCYSLDGELIPYLQQLSEADKHLHFVSLYSRRYASLRIQLTEECLSGVELPDDRKIEAVLVHDDGVIQLYPGGTIVQPDDIHYYEADDYGDDCCGLNGDEYMLYDGKVYEYSVSEE